MPNLDPELVLPVGALAIGAASGSIPVRRPKWVDPAFHSMPLIQTATRRINGYVPSWANAIDLPSRDGYVAVIESFAVASDVALQGNGVQFRFLQGGSLSKDIEILADAEYCRDTSIVPWPCFKRPLKLIVPNGERFLLQVRNLSSNNRYYFAGLFGYYYPDMDPSTFTPEDR